MIAAAFACMAVVAQGAVDDKKQKKQNEIRKMTSDTLQRLYKAHPKAKSAIEDAAGYAVFSDLSVKILLAG